MNLVRSELADAALLIVDVQNDFCPGGSLAVPDGDAVVGVLNRLIDRFGRARRPVIATRDWHPVRTSHFVDQGGPWPPHCIQRTMGAQFHSRLNLPPNALIVSKGMDEGEDGYSGFVGRDDQGRRLANILRDLGVERLVIGGLATDYCVKATVVEGLAAGFAVDVVKDAIRAVELQPGDGERALQVMLAAGASIVDA